MRNHRGQDPHPALQRTYPLNGLEPGRQIIRRDAKPPHLRKRKKAGEENRSSHDHFTGDHGLVAPAPFPRHKNQQRQARPDEEADDGGGVPYAVCAARLHGEEEHENARDEDQAADQIEALDAARDGTATPLLWAEEERHDGQGDHVYGYVDPFRRKRVLVLTVPAALLALRTTRVADAARNVPKEGGGPVGQRMKIRTRSTIAKSSDL